jgi:hypothetical protein
MSKWGAAVLVVKLSGIQLVSYFSTTRPAFFVFILGGSASQTLAFNVSGALCFHSTNVLGLGPSVGGANAHNNDHSRDCHFYHRFLLS